MSREEILEKLKEIAISIDEGYAPGISEVNEQTELLKDMGFSSLQMLFLAVMLEETFHIRIQKLENLRLLTIGDVIDLVEKLMSTRTQSCET